MQMATAFYLKNRTYVYLRIRDGSSITPRVRSEENNIGGTGVGPCAIRGGAFRVAILRRDVTKGDLC